jgi:Bacterial archaeo-eukaryotic release factor family 2
MRKNLNADLAELVHDGGTFSRVLADFPVDEIDAAVPGPRMRSIARALGEAGSSAVDITAITAVLEQPATDRNLVPRFVLVRAGALLVDEFLPDTHLYVDTADHGQLPDLIPLLVERQNTVPYIVVEANAEGGRIRTFLAGRIHPDEEVAIAGETEHLHEAHGGGLSHPRHAHHTEEVWKRNETELAQAVNQLVEQHEIDLLAVTGDPHVVDLVSSALSSRAREVLVTLASDTLARGASEERLDKLVVDNVKLIVRAKQDEAIGRSAAQEAASHSETDRRLQPIVHALQQADVDVLLLDLEALEPHSLLALDGKPWVASMPAESFGAPVLHSIPAAEALVRAAIATDADVLFVDHHALPGDAGAAIVRR